jgi:hypothetical protein
MPVKYRLLAACFLAALLWAGIWFAAVSGLVIAPSYIHGQIREYPGNYAHLYLFDHSPYDRIVIEVHSEPGIQPSTYSLEHLQSIVHKYTGKDVRLRMFSDITPDLLPAYTDNANVSAFGYSFLDRHAYYRTGWTGGTACMYVLYLNGTVPRSGAATVAGVSYRADAFVVFDNYIHNEGIERTVLVHEAGHLLGLEHDGDLSCAMTGTLVENASIRTGRILPPDDYCAKDVQQLERMRYYLI